MDPVNSGSLNVLSQFVLERFQLLAQRIIDFRGGAVAMRDTLLTSD
jgi:hypothetical protein